ncbi:DUF3717 domain-containing protein [Orrella dioscoreae]|uniref:DUF3717 domain-containing protein n=1 Tax=Orrella dioscoreae TaxID=1851544 RepID=UPI00082A1BF4|nr:DUF3717 domain-containing protein [Orrella dioscoreae]
MSTISLPELEAAINYWRARSPSTGEDLKLCPQAAALAVPYAGMIVARAHDLSLDALAPDARDAYAAWLSVQSGQPPA